MKDRALHHLLVAAGRSAADLAPHHAPAIHAMTSSLTVERVERGRFALRWTDAHGRPHHHPLDGARFRLYARGDLSGHVARREPGADHRAHNWHAAHAVWSELLGSDPDELIPTRRTFAPRPDVHRRPDATGERSAAALGAIVGLVAVSGVGRRPWPTPATTAGALGVAALAAGPDAPRPVRLAPLLLAATGAAPVWSATAAALGVADVAAARLRGEPARARRAALGVATVALPLLAAGCRGSTERRPVREHRVAALSSSLVLAAGTLTVVRAPLGTRDRLSGWLAPLALALAAARAEAEGDRSAPSVAAAAVGATLTWSFARRRRPAPRPDRQAAVERAEVDAVIVPLPRRRSA